uniref:Uncharacterized protein n=1 Tax=Triticum urartu TaxID=4572 RepID=A0A8R7RDQ4_TRIUA
MVLRRWMKRPLPPCLSSWAGVEPGKDLVIPSSASIQLDLCSQVTPTPPTSWYLPYIQPCLHAAAASYSFHACPLHPAFNSDPVATSGLSSLDPCNSWLLCCLNFTTTQGSQSERLSWASKMDSQQPTVLIAIVVYAVFRTAYINFPTACSQHVIKQILD